jgi:hypothetical protein
VCFWAKNSFVVVVVVVLLSELVDGRLVVSFISGDGPLSRHTDEFVRFRFSRRRR